MKLYRLLILVGLVTPVIHADTWTDPETGIEWTYTLSDGKVAIGDGGFYSRAINSNYVGPLIIPDAINGNTVYKLSDYAFCECLNITSVIIPERVTSIGNAAFAGCVSLTSLPIPRNVTYIGSDAFSWCPSLTSISIPEGVTSIESGTFSGCSSLMSVSLPDGITSIGEGAFYNCYSLSSVFILKNVTSIGEGAFYNCYSLSSVFILKNVTSIGKQAFFNCIQCKLIFLGLPPSSGIYNIGITPWGDTLTYPKEYASEWEHALQLAQYASGYSTTATVSVRAEMTTPKTMKVTYKVNSPFSRAKVRTVAWKDGVRSFANIVPVKTEAEGSPEVAPNGEAVTTGVEHTFIWQVSNDWSIDLAKVRVEVLAEDAGLLPQDLVTIPATETHAKMTFTVNTPTSAQLFNALVWYYADGDSALTVSNGVVRINGTQVASGSSLTASGCNNTALLNYLYGKLGYKVLSGSDLSYAKAMTRLSLSNSGLDQVSVKISEE